MNTPERPRPGLASLMLLALVMQASPAPAQDGAGVSIGELREALAERDAIIIDLLNRVSALEQALSDSRAPAAERQAALSATGGIGNDQAGSTQPDFEVDLLTAERALERGLVQEGARLLGPGQIDFAPAVTLSRVNGMFPVGLASGDQRIVGEISRTVDVYERRTDLRIGLPRSMQLEIGLPYLTVDQALETGIDGAVQSSMRLTGSGFADATLALSKVLASERGGRPNLIGRFVWLTGTGDELDNGVALGGGHSGLGARLSAYWRRDPVVFLVSGGYTHYADDPGLTPGDSLDVAVGLGLAISPETAVLLSLSQTLADEFTMNGSDLTGTDRLTSTLDLSVSTTIGRRLYLRGYTAAGLTDDSPDYRFGLSLSARFDPR